MILTELTLKQFKNHSDTKISLNSGISAFCGKNGSGKTSILEAIATLALGKAYFFTDKANLQHQQEFFRVSGIIQNTEYSVALGTHQAKKVAKNGIQYDRMIEHLGEIPICVLRPEDIILITGGPAQRRQFIDRTIAQINNEYARNLLQYQNLLKERSALLKSLSSETELHPNPTLDALEHQLIIRNKVIYSVRNHFFSSFKPSFLSVMEEWCPEQEQYAIEADFQYPSQLEWKESRLLDWKWKQSKIGCQKDDLVLKLNGMSLKEIGSQGQVKSAASGLIIASIMSFQLQKLTPIVLIDDAFDKLDSERISAVFAYLKESGVQQIMLSDTDSDRVSNILAQTEFDLHIFEVQNGTVQSKS